MGDSIVAVAGGVYLETLEDAAEERTKSNARSVETEPGID
jgi:hypothetical protein